VRVPLSCSIIDFRVIRRVLSIGLGSDSCKERFRGCRRRLRSKSLRCVIAAVRMFPTLIAQTMTPTTRQSAKKAQVLATIGVKKNKYGRLSVASVTCTPFIVPMPNMTFSVPQLNNPTVSTKPKRFQFGSQPHQGPQHGANSSAATENVSQIFSGASSADAYFCNSTFLAVITSATGTDSCVICKRVWPAAIKGRSNIAMKSTEMVSLLREEVSSVQLRRTAQRDRSQAPTVPGP
jgi:hypothetical protein